MDQETPAMAAYLDWLAERFSELGRFGKTRPLWLYLLLALFAVAFLLRAELRQWWASKRPARNRIGTPVAGPEPFMGRLFGVLAARGFERASSETLAAYARRLRASGGEESGQAALLVQRYAALKYGRHGDRIALTEAVGEYLDSSPA
jgi:hypothetical protein